MQVSYARSSYLHTFATAPEHSSPAEIPPALLGELIGVNANTAAHWAALTSGNWTAYAAEVAST